MSLIKRAFDSMKQILSKEVCLAYPHFTEQFEIYIDASTRQLGAVIVQKNRPIAFFHKKIDANPTKILYY